MLALTFCSAKNQVALKVTEFHGATMLVKKRTELIRKDVLSLLFTELPCSVKRRLTLVVDGQGDIWETIHEVEKKHD